MNRIYKVIFSREKGMLVVASELARTAVKSGAKLVVASAVGVALCMSGTAYATDYDGVDITGGVITAPGKITGVGVDAGAGQITGSGGMDVSGTSTLGSTTTKDLTVTNDALVHGALTVDQKTKLGELAAGTSKLGATTADSLTTGGRTTTNDLTVTNDADVGGALSVTGLTSTGSLSVANRADVHGSAEIDHNLTVKGETSLGATTADSLTVNAVRPTPKILSIQETYRPAA